jgi:hypothetical protein
VHGYGIDAFLLLTAAAAGPVTSVRSHQPKKHAASFPHLPAIYHDVVPVLLHLTAAWTPPTAGQRRSTAYVVRDRPLPHARLLERLSVLDNLAADHPAYDEPPWPQALAHAWHTVKSGTAPHDAAHQLWPHYLRRVRSWLTVAHPGNDQQRAALLADAHNRLHTALTTIGAPR